MQIPETGLPHRVPLASNPFQPVSPPASAVPAYSPAAALPPSLSERLTFFFEALGLDAPPAQVEELAGQLSGLGVAPDELGSEGALRALFLRRNSVPLTAALLRAPASPESPAVFRQATVLLEEAASLLGNRSLSIEAGNAVETLVRDLNTLLGGSAPVSGWLGGMVRDKREESLNPNARVWDGPSGSAPDGLGSVLRKSGMSFEWRLLNWYRSGRDPKLLRDLLHEDLKGMLFNFLRNLEKVRQRERGVGKLEDHVRSLLDDITARQTTQILDGPGRTISLIVPSEKPEERMYAGVRVMNPKRKDPSAPHPPIFSLSLDMETTHLGPVRTHLRFSGKTASATFLLNDLSALELAREMADEFRLLLREHGYDPGVIHFALDKRTSSYPGEEPDTSPTLDIQG